MNDAASSGAPAAALERLRGLLARHVDALVTGALVLGYLVWLVATSSSLGYTRDEGFYFHAARAYGSWFEVLFSEPSRAFDADVVDRFWRENREHPALLKSLFWASDRLLYGVLFDEHGTAHRFPAMLLSALAVGTTFAWGRRELGRAAGLVAAVSFAAMPRVFFHAHLACFDMPITSLWLITGYAYYRSLTHAGVRWAVAAAVLYGLMLNTKHNAWLMPPALALHALLLQARHLREGARGLRSLRVPLALVLMVTLGPLLLYATWPWIWRDTVERFAWYVNFHVRHVYYNMEFLGRTYFEPPFPRSYAWLMTAATVPAITLALAGLGLALTGGRFVAAVRAWREPSPPEAAAPAVRGFLGPLPSAGAELMWLLFMVLCYAPWLSSSTPIFGGTKHWMPAYPYVALFAGVGFAQLVRGLGPSLERRAGQLAVLGLVASAVAAPLWLTAHTHPNGLSAYTPLVGGTPGAASLGLNRGFWGHTTGLVQDFINREAARGERVFLHDTAQQSFRMMQVDGRLRRDLKGTLNVAGSGVALYHHEQHMSRVEHMIWTDYGTTAPRAIGDLDGVPLVWVYVRP